MATTSSWIYAHFAQMVMNHKFRAMDFGPRMNQEIYGSKQPPDFPLDRIESPDICLYYATNDPLSDPPDVQLLIRSLKGSFVFIYSHLYLFYFSQKTC